jgi:hypothetical protein
MQSCRAHASLGSAARACAYRDAPGVRNHRWRTRRLRNMRGIIGIIVQIIFSHMMIRCDV